jgi:MerR family transcriptional regulator/heat shock protein HspR
VTGQQEQELQAEVVAEAVELGGVYIISVAARLLEMHPQTLRKYERFGLIRPSRTAGALRLYSEQDLARLRIVRRLVDELGLNLAGVRLVMEIVSQMEQAIEAIEQDPTARDAPGARTALAHMRATLDYLHA